MSDPYSVIETLHLTEKGAMLGEQALGHRTVRFARVDLPGRRRVDVEVGDPMVGHDELLGRVQIALGGLAGEVLFLFHGQHGSGIHRLDVGFQGAVSLGDHHQGHVGCGVAHAVPRRG